MGKEMQTIPCLVNCHFDRMQCQKSLACATFDTADTTHIMFGNSQDADWLIISHRYGNECRPWRSHTFKNILKKHVYFFFGGLSLISSFSCLINSTIWWTVLMSKIAENLRSIFPQVVFTRSRWYEESDVVCVCDAAPNDSIISHIFRDIITLLACARSRPVMMRTVSHADDDLTLIVSAVKFELLSTLIWICYKWIIPISFHFSIILSVDLFFFSYFCLLFMVYGWPGPPFSFYDISTFVNLNSGSTVSAAGLL